MFIIWIKQNNITKNFIKILIYQTMKLNDEIFVLTHPFSENAKSFHYFNKILRN